MLRAAKCTTYLQSLKRSASINYSWCALPDFCQILKLMKLKEVLILKLSFVKIMSILQPSSLQSELLV